MVIKGNLENSTERVTEQELKNRFKHIEKEIAEVGGVNKNDDKIEIAQGVLNGQFAEFLLKNENKEAFYRLKQDVSKMKNDWNLGNKAGPQLKKLYDFLDDISDEKKMEKDYDEFMGKIQNPKKLNTLKSWEVRRLNLYLGIHEDKALAAYNAMKPIFGKYAENKMEQEDISFFESVWNTLKANYSVSDNFMKEDYPAIEKLQPTSDSLKSLAGENWDGKNESINIPDAENSIVDKSKVKEKVDGINNQRIESNRENVKNITITVDNLSNFTKKDGVLKYEGVEFSVDKMMLLFGNKIKESAGEVASFVNEAERDDMIDDCKNDIFSKLKNDLLNNDGVREENPDEDEEGGENTEEPKFRTYEEGKENFKIKMSALKDRIKELEFYDGNEDGEKVKFDIEKVKVYLEGLKDKSWNELECPSDPVDKGLWTIAVQIVLNYLATRDENSDYNVHYIDGIRGNETLKGVKAFQEANGLKFKNNQPDGLPGKVTIAKLLEVLGGKAIEDTSDS